MQRATSAAASFTILGGGSVTTEYHLPALARLGRTANTVVVEPDEQSAAALAARHPGVALTREPYVRHLETLGPAPITGAECVIVALPNHLHVDAVTRALMTGRHVLCEKPLALKASDCARLRHLAETQGVTLKVAMSRRYLPALLLARQIVTAGELGEVTAIEVRDCAPFLWRPRSFAFFAREGGGILADMGVHYLDYIATLVGPMTPVSYQDDARGGVESTLSYGLRAGAVPIDLRLSRLQRSDTYLFITCARGSIRIDKGDEQTVIVTPHGARARRASLEQPFDVASWSKNFHGSFCQMLADFERATAGESTPIADVRDAEHTAFLIDWAYAHRVPAAPALSFGAAAAPDTPVLVTGATGFIGGHLVERLAGAGAKLRVTVRSPSTCANVSRFPVEMVPTDLLDTVSVRKAVNGMRTVYHLAYGTEPGRAASITVEGTRNVINAAIDAGVDCVVVLSTMYVFGFPDGDRPVDETFPYMPYGGEYGETKAEMERWCLGAAKSAGRTRIVVLNPTCVFGPGGGAYTCLPVDLAKTGQFCWIDGGSGSCNFVYIDNLLDAVLTGATVPAAHGERFIINDGTVTWRAFLSALLDPIGLSLPSYSLTELARLPRYGGPFRLRDLVSAAVTSAELRSVAKRSAAVRSLFKLAQRHGAPAALTSASGRGGVVHGVSPMPPEWLGPLFGPASASFSSAKAQKLLGWQSRIDLPSAQAATIRWLVETGRLPDATSVP
jgi:predicted dehydrogenase/nucleoside-diphosphate-sugar epimerase